ncbi:helix-turn-helix domain-containing protein [Lactococcus lactis]|nr:helix-turn-helix domain-containing protein [Lactococcus lactis]MDR7696420.1 AraC family transcriptional regulator [Lactococcus lactis]
MSYLLGYSEVSSFTRAFRKWTGMTLNQYRKKLI